ncbi:hypothetical protein KEM52_001948 [Ascosphaera acerosa]|nr:hypothetical protein KEM52_001948 [Ascosphaera acerosa]
METSVPAVPPPLDADAVQRLLASCSLHDLAYPATTRVADGAVDGVATTAMCVSFSDRILLTISQGGKLAQWFSLPLENSDPGNEGVHRLPDPAADDALLPSPMLAPSTLIGARGTTAETVGQLLARQVGSAIAVKTPDERRTLMLGLGLERKTVDAVTMRAQVMAEIVDLALRCL